jgi:hypothetical protein
MSSYSESENEVLSDSEVDWIGESDYLGSQIDYVDVYKGKYVTIDKIEDLKEVNQMCKLDALVNFVINKGKKAIEDYEQRSDAFTGKFAAHVLQLQAANQANPVVGECNGVTIRILDLFVYNPADVITKAHISNILRLILKAEESRGDVSPLAALFILAPVMVFISVLEELISIDNGIGHGASDLIAVILGVLITSPSDFSNFYEGSIQEIDINGQNEYNVVNDIRNVFNEIYEFINKRHSDVDTTFKALHNRMTVSMRGLLLIFKYYEMISKQK